MAYRGEKIRYSLMDRILCMAVITAEVPFKNLLLVLLINAKC